jgi:tetratricopeptide (TPR) repeat protein
LIVSLCDVSRYDEAIAFYETSVDHFKTAPELVTQAIAEQHLATARSYEEADLLAEAMTEYQKALSFHDISLARLALAGIYLKLGYLDKAERELELCLNSGSENAQMHVLWGLLQLKRKRFATAEQHFQSALHLDQGHGPAKTLLAYAQDLKLQAVAN